VVKVRKNVAVMAHDIPQIFGMYLMEEPDV